MGFIKRIIPQPIKIFIGHYTSKCYEIVKTSWLYILVAGFFCKEQGWHHAKGRKIILVNTPTYPNLGDQAIAIAEIKFIEDYFPDDTLVELHDDIFFDQIKKAKKYITDNDVIVCSGGGNMGTDYFWCEKVRQTVIKMFPNNKIVVFPQTIFFANNRKAQKALRKSMEIYNSHSHLQICAREQKSYDVLTENYKNCKVVMVPDIVLYLQPKFEEERTTALLCFRNDREKAVSEDVRNGIICTMKQRGYTVKLSDTVLGGKVAVQERKTILWEKLREFAGAKVVVTDRLHGMIFSYITKTPCVVLPNYNHKVEGFYAWFEKHDNRSVKLIKAMDHFEKTLDALDYSAQNDSSWTGSFYKEIVDFINDEKK